MHTVLESQEHWKIFVENLLASRDGPGAPWPCLGSCASRCYSGPDSAVLGDDPSFLEARDRSGHAAARGPCRAEG